MQGPPATPEPAGKALERGSEAASSRAALEVEGTVKESTVHGKSSEAGDDAASSIAATAVADSAEPEPADGDAAPPWSWRQFAAFCGPGLLMSVAYLVRMAQRRSLRGAPGRLSRLLLLLDAVHPL